MPPSSPPHVHALIATVPRMDLLLGRALPSIARQTRPPASVFIVSDKTDISPPDAGLIRKELRGIPVHFLRNRTSPGAAGTWNTGILDIARHDADCYVAILDDDDEWDPDHLEACAAALGTVNPADAVISGLRGRHAAGEILRVPPVSLTVDDFLVGNPGWQGSNTFIRLGTLLKAGLFTDGLASCNDRDLAIRVLSLLGVRMAFTGRFTATWHLGSSPDQLSLHGNEQKRAGLARFLQLHGHRMNSGARNAFFERAYKLFGFSESEILSVHGKQ